MASYNNLFSKFEPIGGHLLSMVGGLLNPCIVMAAQEAAGLVIPSRDAIHALFCSLGRANLPIDLNHTVLDYIIPEIARGQEVIYLRFMNGKLIYKQGQPDQVILPFAQYVNPQTLEGTFDLSRCEDSGRYLSIATGYRKQKNPANKNTVEIWFAPRFFLDKERASSARHFDPIMNDWDPMNHYGIFWTWWENGLKDYNYLVHEAPDKLSHENLREKFRKSKCCWGVRWYLRARAEGEGYLFTLDLR